MSLGLSLGRVNDLASPSGGFVVVWKDDRNRNGFYQIRAREFDWKGSPLSGDRTINADAGGDQQSATVTVTDAGGRYVVAWEDDLNKNNRMEILARGLPAPAGPDKQQGGRR